MRKYVATVAAAAGVVGGTIGYALEDIRYTPYPETEQDIYAIATEDFEEALIYHENVGRTVGETCLNVLRPYRDGGILSDADLSVVVSDIASDPTNPCGETLTAVRENVHLTFDADYKKNKAGRAFGDAKSKFDAALVEHQVSDDFNPWLGVIVWGGGAAMLGAMAGVVANNLRSTSKSYRNNENIA